MIPIIGFGASSMQGVGDSKGGFFKRLSRAMPKRKFINLGVGGNTTRDMLERVWQVQAAGEHDVIVLLGCNDLPRARDAASAKRTLLAEYARNVKQILAAAKGRHSLFISSFAVSEELTGVTAKKLELYMTRAMKHAREAGYDVWDLYKDSKSDAPDYWAKDGLHFNDEGHAMIARELKKRIKSW